MGDSTERATSDISRDIDEDGNVSLTNSLKNIGARQSNRRSQSPILSAANTGIDIRRETLCDYQLVRETFAEFTGRS